MAELPLTQIKVDRAVLQHPLALDELDLVVRDASAIVVAIEGVNVAASVVTLATLRPRMRSLACALRRWRLRQPQADVLTLTVTGNGIGLRIDLPPNVQTAELLDSLRPLTAGRPPASDNRPHASDNRPHAADDAEDRGSARR